MESKELSEEDIMSYIRGSQDEIRWLRKKIDISKNDIEDLRLFIENCRELLRLKKN